MPEQITKYPDVTLQVLKEAGARCGGRRSAKDLDPVSGRPFLRFTDG